MCAYYGDRRLHVRIGVSTDGKEKVGSFDIEYPIVYGEWDAGEDAENLIRFLSRAASMFALERERESDGDDGIKWEGGPP